MLILIAGVTGLTGVPCARAALDAGHQVRGLGRNPDKLPKDVAERLESFVKSDGFYDLAALDQAVAGVDAIISAMNSAPESIVEGQLLLLRAAERANVKVFHSSSWNYDWTKLQLGDLESYDCFLTFYNHARISSSIKPLHAISGCIPEFVFYHSPHSNPLDKANKRMNYVGTGDEAWQMTPLKDLAAYTIQAVSAPEAANGGLYYVESFQCSIRDMAMVYGQIHGIELEMNCMGTAEDVDRMLDQARAATPPTEYLKYIGLAYAKHLFRKTFLYEAVDSKSRWNNVKKTGMIEWFETNRDI